LLFDTPLACLKNYRVVQKNDWVSTPKSSLSVSLLEYMLTTNSNTHVDVHREVKAL